jgi:hypothetical protein
MHCWPSNVFPTALLLLLLSSHALALDKPCWRNTACTGPTKASFDGPWSINNFAPKTRNVTPVRILDRTGKVIGPWAPTTLAGKEAVVVLDFGIEVGGIVHFSHYTAPANVSVGLAFAESKYHVVGPTTSDASNGASNGAFRGPDGYVTAELEWSFWGTKWVMEDRLHRGGFRYLTLFLPNATNASSVYIRDLHVEIGFQPTWADLRAYRGYFDSSDDQLNKIWYAGAYTLQTNCVPTDTGRMVPMLKEGWANNSTLGPGTTIMVDGAKRDRAVWPGDLGIAVPSAFVSTGDLESVKNALQVMYDYQVSTYLLLCMAVWWGIWGEADEPQRTNPAHFQSQDHLSSRKTATSKYKTYYNIISQPLPPLPDTSNQPTTCGP